MSVKQTRGLRFDPPLVESAGLVSLDYDSGQTATSGSTGFLTSTDWTKFNKSPENLADFYTNVNYTGSDTDAYSYTLPAGKLANNGDKLEIFYSVNIAATLGNRRVRAFFGSTTLYDTGSILASTLGTNVQLRLNFIRSGTTTARVSGTLNSAASQAIEGDLTGLDFTVNNIIKITMSSSLLTLGDLTAKHGFISKRSAT